MSLWKKISLGVLIFIVLLLGTVAFLVGTTTGLHLLFNAANRWVPGLEIGQVTGGWRDLRLKNIRYEQPGVAVNAGEFHLAVRLGCLRDSKLCVNDLSLKDVNVAIDSEKMPKSAPVEEEDSGPLNLSTPYPIALYRVALDNVNVKIDDTTVSVMDFTSGLRWQEKKPHPDANHPAGIADRAAEGGGRGARGDRRAEDPEPTAGRETAG
ncbi:protein YtfN [Enterobacter cloacae]|uniref:Protein YtfN n=1 Tax=Enterobacter cloacae TaxID=550 RepID=A0A377M9K4_ENTCL|nr:protein YtfN [Enterobacter cloacae]